MTHSHEAFYACMSRNRLRIAGYLSELWHAPWFKCVPWLIHVCDMSNSYMWHDSPSVCMTWRIASSVCHDSYTSVTCLLHTCDMTRHLYVWHDSSSLCVTWLVISMCDMTHCYVCVERVLTRTASIPRAGTCSTHTYASFHTCVTHISTSHTHTCHADMSAGVTRMNESCHTYEWVMSHVWMSYVTCMNESHMSHRNECGILVQSVAHLHVWHDSFIFVPWLIHMCDMTHSYVWNDSFICVTWVIHMCDVTHSHVCRDSFIRVTCLIHMYGMIHWYVWRDSFICVTWLIHMCDMTHSYV